MSDELYMKRALALASMGRGRTSPNPLVGAVIVKDGRIIAEGFHREYGGRHAEIEAIDASASSVVGATLYCTLEPCCHSTTGKHNPPCTDRILHERISRVVVANVDPNPNVNGKGLKLLAEKGIAVVSGVCAAEGARLNEAYFTGTRTGKPFVTVKIAQSLDGRIATKSGLSRWITDENARAVVHGMRASCDAVLVGSGTIITDNPSLTVRTGAGRNPLRVILDGRLRIPLDSRVVSDGHESRTIVCTTERTLSTREGRYKAESLSVRGVEVIGLPSDHDGHPDLDAVLIALYSRNIQSVLVEGGSAVFTGFFYRCLFDKAVWFISPLIIGSGVDAIQDIGTATIAEAIRLFNVNFSHIGEQVLLEGYRFPFPQYDRPVSGVSEGEDECLPV